jgi:hypothetical protein
MNLLSALSFKRWYGAGALATTLVVIKRARESVRDR